MSEKAALLRGIKDAPQDDAPRLIFADWLEENEGAGPGKAARDALAWAGYIRRAIRAARCPRTDPEHWELQEPQLRPAAAIALLPSALRQVADYERGFPDGLRMNLGLFLARVGELADCPAPLYRLDLTRGTREVPELVQRPELRLFRRLRLGDLLVGDAEATALARCPHLANLTALDLGQGNVGPDGLAAIVTSDHLHNLSELGLGRSDLGSAEVLRIAQSPSLAGLEKLDIGHAPFDAAAGLALATSPHLRRLRELRLWATSCQAGWLQAVVAGALPSLTALHLSGPPGAPSGALTALLQSPRFGALTDLHLGFAKLSPRDWTGVPENSGPPGLLFTYAPCDPEVGAAFVRSAAVRRCSVICLGHTPLGPADILALACSGRASNLRVLRIIERANEFPTAFSDESVRAFAESPHLAGLVELSVWGHALSDAGLEALARATFADTLRELRLYDSRFSPRQLIDVAEGGVFPKLRWFSARRPRQDFERAQAALRGRFENVELR
jgi:uncharacterized protein (TIGR02996 family)